MKKFLFIVLLLIYTTISMSAKESDIQLTVRYVVQDYHNDKKGIFIQPTLKNISNRELSVLRRPEDYCDVIHENQSCSYKFIGRKRFPEGDYYIESKSDYSTVNLLPGQEALLPPVSIVDIQKLDGYRFVVLYYVEEVFGEMMKVWTGSLKRNITVKSDVKGIQIE